MGSTGSEGCEVEYRIIQLPLQTPYVPNLTDYAAKFRSVKLSSLEQSPTEWIYKHSDEAHHPLSVWEDRLKRNNIVHACIATSGGDASVSNEEALLHGEWAGFGVLRGPFSVKDYYASPEMQMPVPEHPEDETRWHFYDLYTFPAHRRQGVARKLIFASLDVAKERTRLIGEKNKRIARVRLIANPNNPMLLKIYNGLGFARCGMIELQEALVANGMAESIPARDAYGEEAYVKKYASRYGLIMDRVLDVEYDD